MLILEPEISQACILARHSKKKLAKNGRVGSIFLLVWYIKGLVLSRILVAVN